MPDRAISQLIMHLAAAHGQDADTLAMAFTNGDLFNLHRRVHESMHQAGDIFHRTEKGVNHDQPA